ncbi:MAG: chorismate mutase [Alphaproteobacteria bacterium]|nr:chorismate mutase [Alphaproteobacteria bacterium]
MASENATLPELRGEIDRIDDALHDLLIRRGEVVERIGALKKGLKGASALVPGREAQILQRLVARHRGGLPRAVVVRLWREMFASLVGLQGPFTLAVYMPRRGAGYLEIAHEQFGSYTPAISYTSVGQVIRAVTDGSATVGVLPRPQEDDASPWWPMILSDSPSTPKIVARLPFCGPGPTRGEGLEAMAVARMAYDPSGKDRTVLTLETDREVSRASMLRTLATAGLEDCSYEGLRFVTADTWLHLIETGGYVPNGDERLKKLLGAEAGAIKRTNILGGYAVPFTPADMKDPVP